MQNSWFFSMSRALLHVLQDMHCYTMLYIKKKKKLHDMMPLDSLSLQSLLVKLLDTFFKDLRASGSPIAAHYPSHQGFQSPG